ncbi:MAG TPA: DUF1491 family protein [Alphaproteobacteria bacterium]|jgi:hypothetical protein|nr:DUF1491 family protein [Alphaproteobacteria bacterium]
MQPRLTAEFWVKAHIRRCMAEAIPVVVVRRGDATAGALLIKLNRLDHGCTVLAAVNTMDGSRGWRQATGAEPVSESDADAYIERQIGYDPDIWVLEIEDREGRHLLQEPVLTDAQG